MRKRKIWVLPDTHWFHDFLWKEGHRPRDYNEQIINNCLRLISEEDTVIHLGDVIFARKGNLLGAKDMSLRDIIKNLPGTWVLVRGNHDHESDGWYMRNGFTMVCHGLQLGQVWLTHQPAHQLPDGALVNVH